MRGCAVTPAKRTDTALETSHADTERSDRHGNTDCQAQTVRAGRSLVPSER
jgi:hypothetical protein